jgi:hypothetical protein
MTPIARHDTADTNDPHGVATRRVSQFVEADGATHRTSGHVPPPDDPSWVSAAIREWAAGLKVREPLTGRCVDPS